MTPGINPTLRQNTKLQAVRKHARIVYLARLLDKRSPGRPRKRELDTAGLAKILRTTQRSVQRDLHIAQEVREVLKSFGKFSLRA